MLQAQFEENEQSVTGRFAFWSIGEQLPLTPSLGSPGRTASIVRSLLRMGGCSSPFTVIHLAVRPKRFPADYADRFSGEERRPVFNRPPLRIASRSKVSGSLEPLANSISSSCYGSNNSTIAPSQKK